MMEEYPRGYKGLVLKTSSRAISCMSSNLISSAIWACNSVGERRLCKAEVEGSNPFRSTNQNVARLQPSAEYPAIGGASRASMAMSPVKPEGIKAFARAERGYGG